MSDENPKMAEIRQSVEDSYGRITGLVNERLTELNPGQLYLAPAENEWSLMECLAHIREVMPYWANEIAQLVKEPGQKFGRVMSDPARLRAIEEHGHDDLKQVQAALPVSYACLQEVLAGLTDADLTKTGIHSRFGERPLKWHMREFVTDHLKNHFSQLRDCLVVVSTAEPDPAKIA